jgi:pyruvate, water dikinase
MRLPFSSLRKKRPPSLEGLESVRSLFSKFRRIQKLNSKALAHIAEMERALGGEYIFDRSFLESSARELGKIVYQVVYSLNAMSNDRYVGLFDRFQAIGNSIDDILSGGLGPLASSLTLPYSSIHWDLEPLTGALNICLAEARNSLGLLAPDGFAITTTGCRLLLEANGLDPAGLGSACAGIADAVFPARLEKAIRSELSVLSERCGGQPQLVVRACCVGGRREEPELEGVRGISAEGILSAITLALQEYAEKTADSGTAENAPALAVYEETPAFVAGTVSTEYSTEFPAGLFKIFAEPMSAPNCAEQYLVRKTYPYGLVQSQICEKEPGRQIYPGIAALSKTHGRLYRGSALLGPNFLRTIAEGAVTLERMFDSPLQLRWTRGKSDHPVITGVHFIHGPEKAAVGDLGEKLKDAEILLKGGETVQAGIAAGRTVLVSDDADPEQVPHGAIALAHSASPQLSLILRRASALITEVGTSIGHLATIARELRVPAIFGAADALQYIPEGIEVTVDAGERTVYSGVIESLLACRDWGIEFHPDDPEYAMLRRLLRRIMPLDLIDPESKDFSIENCHTYHDIIHYSHEKSVEELLKLEDLLKLKDCGRDPSSLKARKLNLEVPIDLFVLDLGGGLSDEAGASISPEDVTSEPFKAFLRGLGLNEMWNREPVSLKLKDLFSNLDRTFSAMGGGGEYAGRNHAIVAENYMNAGLRLGYHFSVVDCYLGENVNQNYIYFRFAGGFAEEKRRRRRAGLIGSILKNLRFKTTIKGDLVTAKLKVAEREEIETALTCLGELTAFTRQLDLNMASEETVQRFAALFADKSTLGRRVYRGEDLSGA